MEEQPYAQQSSLELVDRVIKHWNTIPIPYNYHFPDDPVTREAFMIFALARAVIDACTLRESRSIEEIYQRHMLPVGLKESFQQFYSIMFSRLKLDKEPQICLFADDAIQVLRDEGHALAIVYESLVFAEKAS